MASLGMISLARAQSEKLSVIISFRASGLSFSQVMQGFEQRTGVVINYDAGLVAANRRFNIAVESVRAGTALRDFLNGVGLDYVLKAGSVVVIKRDKVIRQDYFAVSGRVRVSGSGEFISGAQLVLFQPSGEKYVFTSDAGFFSMLVRPGTYALQIYYPGYLPLSDTLRIDRNYLLQYELTAEDDSTKEVKITALKGKGLQSVQIGQTDHNEVNRIKMKWVPQLLGEPDIVRTMSMMPGVVGGSEGMLGMYVRGGAADQNLVLLDDVPLFNSYHLYGIFSVFNEEVVRSATLIKGSFPGRYGGRLSSVVNVHSREGDVRKIKGSLNVGVLAAKVFLEGPLVKDRTTFIFSFRRSHLDFLARPAASLILYNDSFTANNLYYFWDANARVTHRFSNRSRLSLGFYMGRDVGGLSEKTGSESVEVSTSERRKQITGWGNTMIGLKWNYQAREGTELVTRVHMTGYEYSFTQDYSFYRNSKFNPQTNVDDYTRYRLRNGITDVEGAVQLNQRLLPWLKLEAGTGYVLHRFIPGNRSQYSRISGAEKELVFNDDRLDAHEVNAFAELQGSRFNRWYWTACIRTSYFSGRDSVRYLLPEPRLSLKYRINHHQFLHASASRTRQFFHLLNNLSLGLPSDLWVPSSRKFGPGLSDQFSLGYAFSNKVWAASSSVFFRSFKNLLEYRSDAGYVTSGLKWEESVTAGSGEAYGMEWLLEKTAGKLNGWLAYTLMWNNRWFAELNDGHRFPARYDRRHNIYLTAVYHLKKGVDLSASWTYSSGFAYTLPIARYASPAPNDPYREIFIYGDRNNARARDNHRLDIAVSFEKVRKHYTRTWTLGVFNAYNRFNPFYVTLGYDNSGQRKLYQVSLMPLLPNISYRISI